MAEVKEFTLPDLGEGLTEAMIVRWLVAIGDVVAVDQPVVEVETAKAMVEVPCPYGGVVTARFGEEGADIPVGTPLITVAVGEGAEAAGGRAGGGEGTGRGEGTDEGAGEGSGNVLVGYGTEGPRGRRNRVGPLGGAPPGPPVTGAGTGRGRPPLGGEPGGPGEPEERAGLEAPGEPGGPGGQGVPPGGAGGPGEVPGRVTARGTPAPPDTASAQQPTGDRTRAPDRAAGAGGGLGWSAAGEGAVPVQPQVGAGGRTQAVGRFAPGGRSRVRPPGGREPGGPEGARAPVAVVSPLVRRLAREHGIDLHTVTGTGPDGLILRADIVRAIEAAAAAADTVTAPRAPAAAGRIPLRGPRGAAADKLARSHREIPDATCWVDADATELLEARRAMNSVADHYGPKISLLALLARICVAALDRFPELNATVDTDAREIVVLPAVHLGFAAQTDRGLVVPVVRDAQERSINSLSEEITRLTEVARAGTATPGELTGGTFTLNNYGVFGVDGSTPIINHPEVAMLGVGRIAPKPWVHEGELAVRHVVELSLTFDHRVCDGATAAGFLRFVADCVEQPAVLLRGL